MQKPTFDAFQAIADPNRRYILRLLTKETLTINKLSESFEMSRPAVSKHIKVLCNAGFITIQDIGRERHCILKKDGFKELQKWIAFFDNFWSANLNRLGKLLDE